MLSDNALWSLLVQMRLDESAGTSVSPERKREALSHLCAHLSAKLGIALCLDEESIHDECRTPMGVLSFSRHGADHDSALRDVRGTLG